MSSPPGRLAAAPAPVEERVVTAFGRCVARWGVAKTTLDDVAREAGCSRATVYRAVPGGKDGMLEALVRTEVDRFFGALGGALATAGGLEDRLVAGITEAARFVQGHAALQHLLAYEPEVVLPHVAFARMDAVLTRLASFAAPWLAPWLVGRQAVEAAEWVTRLVCSYLLCPSEHVDLADEDDARQLVRTFVLPGLAVSTSATPDTDR